MAAHQLTSQAKAMMDNVRGSTTGTSDKDRALESHRVENSAKNNHITTNWGVKIDNTDDSLKVGPRGPTLIQDFHFREKMTHFDHERIPERVVHARGSAAHGFFQVYESQEKYTKARFLCDPSLKTPVFVRFSTVLGSRGSADTVRDVRGFATKFYTPEGNFDLVGNNIPVFFIQDAIKFPDIIHAGKPEPHNEIPQAQTAHDNFWDIISLMPESIHMTLWTLSDRAIPRSYRMMEGFGVNTFILVNAEGKRRFVKFHWKPLLGVHSLAWDECQKLGGQDPDYHRRDLWEAIESGNYPEYELGLQIIDEEQEHSFDFDILDATKFVPEEIVPVIRVGKMVLDRNPTDFFAETEQVAFCTQHVVPGIDFSDDPLLQGRNFSYQDTQLTRLGGPNWQEIPINRPMCPVANNQRDGFMRQTIGKGRVNYYPNRLGFPCPATASQGAFVSYPEKVEGMKERMRGPKFQEHYSQATLFWNSLNIAEKDHLVSAGTFELGKVDLRSIQEKMLEHYNRVAPELAQRIAAGLGLPAPAPLEGWKNHGRASGAISQENTIKGSIATRRIAFLVAKGYDYKQLTAMRAAVKGAGGMTFIIAPHKGDVTSSTGENVGVDFTYFTSKSTLFDSLFVPGGHDSVQTLMKMGDALQFINEAYKHCKPIGASGEGVDLLKCSFLPGVKLATRGDDQVVSDHGVVTAASPKILGSLGETATAVVGSAVAGAVAGVMGPGGLAGEYIAAVGQHRFWKRDVSQVPA